MKNSTDCFQLQNGVNIPCIGFGTWQAPDGETAVEAVKAALSAGYRHIDTAAIYGNEESIGKAVESSKIPREELFITTKLWNGVRGYDETIKAFEESMEKLRLDYLDLYLIHWPNPIAFRSNWKEKNSASWSAFEDLHQSGKIRSIGVSNFMPHHIDALLKDAKVVPMVNQIRLCPGVLQKEAVDYCEKNKILIQAYSPLGTGKVFEIPEMIKLSKKYSKSIAQICIRWSLQKGFLPLPKSVTESRIIENSNVFDFVITEEDMNCISGLQGCGEAKDPDQIQF